MASYSHHAGGKDMEAILDKFSAYLVNHKNYSPATAKAYRRLIQSFCEDRGILKPTDITPLVVDDYCDERIARGLKIDSNAIFMNCVRSFIRFSNRYYDTNINLEMFEVPRRKGRRTDYLTAEEITKMVEVCPRERDRLMLLVAFTSGCRASELVQMTCENTRGNKWTCIVKGGKEHTYYFGPSVYERLQMFLYMMNISTGAIWRSTTDKPIKQSAYAMMVRNIAVKAGITRPISSHKLRHGFATAMLENGTDIRTLAEMMGHTSIQTTERYLHVTDKRQAEHHQQFAPKVINPAFPQTPWRSPQNYLSEY